jgi:predicted dehydrogenase
MVGHILRFDGGYKRLYDSVKNNELGEVIHISAGRKTSKLLAEILKGRTSLLYHLGVHDIDIVQWVSQQKIKKVYAQRIINVNKKWNSEDCIYVTANLGENAVANFEFAWTFPKDFPAGISAKLEVFGTKATGFVNRCDLGVQIFKEKNENLPVEFTDIIHWPEINGKIVGDLKQEIDHFCEAVLKNEKFLMSTDDAISAVNVVESIFESYKKGIPIEVKEI